MKTPHQTRRLTIRVA